MSDDNTPDLPVEQEQVTGLDAILDKAMEGFDAPPAEASSDEAKTAAELKADATGRLHGDKGRFAPKELKTDAKASDGATEAKVTAAEATPPVDPAQQQQIVPHPRWNEARKAAFNGLPPEAKKFALEVQSEHEAAFTRKSQEDAEYRRTADPLVQAVQPFAEYLAKIAPTTGMSPAHMVNGILAAEYQLRTGDPRQKYQAFANLAHTYGVDLAALSRGEIAQADPLISQLRQQVSELTQRFGSIESQTAQEQQRSLSLHIDSFANAKNEAGQPKYPHFGRVRGYMGQLMANGEVSTLEDAYTKATEPIREAVAQELGSRQRQAEESNKAALDKARKAAPVKSSGTQPNGSAKGKGLDAILSEAMTAAGM